MPTILQVQTPIFWISVVLDSHRSATHMSSQLCADWDAKCVHDKTRQLKIAVVWFMQVDFPDDGGSHHRNTFECRLIV